MGWEDLLDSGDETVILPWFGGRIIRSEDREWKIKGGLPVEHGWYSFSVSGRTATVDAQSDPDYGIIRHCNIGYLVGDRFVNKGAKVDPDPSKIYLNAKPVHFIDEGVDRFAPVSVGYVNPWDPLVFKTQEFPQGQEDDVMSAFLDKKESVSHIKGVTPALDAAFRMESWNRAEVERRREALIRVRREEEERRAQEERMRQVSEKLGDGAGRREMALIDFDEAAKAALAVGGAELLDVRNGVGNEKVVRYRLAGRRFECVCDEAMRIHDSGICLTDESSGEKGDDRLTLESLPSVVLEAIDTNKLVVYRHV